MNEAKKWRMGCLVLVALFCIGTGLVVVLGAFSFFGGANKSLSMFSGDQIGIIRVSDIIISSEEIVEGIYKLKKEESIKALVIRLNSPGGGVAASQEIYEAVLDFKKSGKKVIISMGGIAASGAYYIACAGDTVIANPGTITGSIGVIFQFPYFQKLFKKIGVEMEVIKSGDFKDAGSPHRKMSKKERAVFQQLIDDTWMQFVEAVSNGRGIPIESVKKLADGRIFSGKQALAVGLVDQLGTFEFAKGVARKAAGLSDDAKTFEFHRKKAFWERVMGDLGSFLPVPQKRAPNGLLYLFLQ